MLIKSIFKQDIFLVYFKHSRTKLLFLTFEIMPQTTRLCCCGKFEYEKSEGRNTEKGTHMYSERMITKKKMR